MVELYVKEIEYITCVNGEYMYKAYNTLLSIDVATVRRMSEQEYTNKLASGYILFRTDISPTFGNIYIITRMVIP
jgi:hypothetical protein